MAVDQSFQSGECVELLAEWAAARGEDRDADTVLGDWRHVRLRIVGPIDLHAVSPRLHRYVTADTPPACARGGAAQPERGPDRRVQSVRGGQVAGAEIAAAH